ncbi:glycosyltransferase family 4 protein [bacterium]|nr:glycosyltransferase family 4 protein [bacterium]
MIRILFVEQYSEVSGAEVIALRTLEVLMSKFDIELHSIVSGKGKLQKDLEELGSKIHFHSFPPILSRKISQKPSIDYLVQIINDCQIDMVYSNMIRGGYYSALAAKKTEKVFVWHLNETVSPMKKLYLSNILTSRNVNTIAVSYLVKSVFGIKKTKIIENPVSDKILFHKDFDADNFGYFGRLIPEKGIHLSLIRFSEVLKILPEAKFFIYGDERNMNKKSEIFLNKLAKKYKLGVTIHTYTEFLRSLVEKLGISERTYFKGHESDLNTIFDNISFLTVPSMPILNEAFGLTAFEAMRAGRIVFSSDTGAFRNYLENGVNGYRIDFSKKNSLLKLIEKLNSDRALIDVIRKRGFEFSKKFSESDFDENICNYFKTFF